MSDHNPMQYLIQEHDVISGTLPLVSRLNHLWDSDPDAYRRSVSGLLEFYRRYADQFHHQKEEEILFKELRDLPEFTLEEIIDELESHHESFRTMIGSMENALEENRFQETHNQLVEYLDQLMDHIAIENDELFVMAEHLFKQQALENMYFRFLDTDERLGGRFKQELIDGLDRI